ncbi:MAG TPA: hypothetical protein VN876_00920 [Gemmatimonadaceae bacterium]|nr:hypothetical protein [Gemmatimonadaceae bacterium]
MSAALRPLLDSYLTPVSNRLGMATKALSVVATVTLPFVVVGGRWGMISSIFRFTVIRMVS